MLSDDLPEWFNQLVDWQKVHEGNYQIVNGILVESNVLKSSSIWTKSQFADRALTRFSTTWCEQQLAENLVDRALLEIVNSGETVFADFGSGDGRLTKSLLARGARKIVVTNFELEPLLTLRGQLQPDELQRVQMVCGDITSSLLLGESIDFALAWGLWTSCHDFIEAREMTINYVKKLGIILNAEPILEQYLAYAMVMGDAAELLRVLKSRTRPISWQEREIRYRLMTQTEVRNHVRCERLEIIWERAISAFPSLFFGGLCNGKRVDETLKEEIWYELQQLDDSPYWSRQLVFLSRRRAT